MPLEHQDEDTLRELSKGEQIVIIIINVCLCARRLFNLKSKPRDNTSNKLAVVKHFVSALATLFNQDNACSIASVHLHSIFNKNRPYIFRIPSMLPCLSSLTFRGYTQYGASSITLSKFCL